MTDMKKETIQIEGMSCGHCVQSVRDALEVLPLTVEDVQIGTATVRYDPAQTNHDTIVEAIEDVGFVVPA